MNLRTRFSLFFIGFTFCVLCVFGGAYYLLERRNERRRQENEQMEAVAKAASVCRAMYISSNVTTALNYIKAFKKDSSILFISCVNAQGLVLAHSDSQWIGRRIQEEGELRLIQADQEGSLTTRIDHGPPVAPGAVYAPGTAREENGLRAAEWYSPVYVGTAKVGGALVAYNQALLEKEIAARLLSTLRQLLWVAGGTFLLAVLIALALASGLSRPILGLVDAAHEIGGGNLEYQTPIVGRSDELGRLAREMNEMARKLRALDELKDEFVSTVSHDLRSPMAAISMHLDYMLNVDDEKNAISPRHYKMLQMIRESAVKLSVYVSNILDAAKIKASRMEYHYQPVDLRAAIGDVAALFAAMAENRGISLTTKIAPDLPSIRTDPERIEQMLSNLVSNALKFTPPEGVITLSAAPADGCVEISVADTGEGIAPEHLPRLFQRFNQFEADARKEKRVLGTGLGLYIVKQTVEALGGSVAVSSKLRQGTRFSIRLPIANGGTI